jgi:hypothetical protein
MAHTTYSSHLFRPRGASLGQLLRELYAATPLAILLRALHQVR